MTMEWSGKSNEQYGRELYDFYKNVKAPKRPKKPVSQTRTLKYLKLGIGITCFNLAVFFIWWMFIINAWR